MRSTVKLIQQVILQHIWGCYITLQEQATNQSFETVFYKHLITSFCTYISLRVAPYKRKDNAFFISALVLVNGIHFYCLEISEIAPAR